MNPSNSCSAPYDIAVLIGRFQPVHAGHLALMREALSLASEVVVVLGSAHAARSVRNPFTWEERRTMMIGALSSTDADRVCFAPVRDYYDEARWATAVAAEVAASAQYDAASHGGLAASVCLVGHFKDASSGYLRSFPAWALRTLPKQGQFDATPIRDAWLAGDEPGDLRLGSVPPIDALAVPTNVRQFLGAFDATEFLRLHQEWATLRRGREQWADAPYPPIFVTVDALLHDKSHVLLIRRGKAPGQGLIALPGGFLEEDETLLKSCLRELSEETHCALTDDECWRALQEVQVFAHPSRSQRGRTITHVHRFDLTALPATAVTGRPAVRADDDAAEAFWVPIADLGGLEDAFFEDHFHILDRFLTILPLASTPVLNVPKIPNLAESDHLPNTP